MRKDKDYRTFYERHPNLPLVISIISAVLVLIEPILHDKLLGWLSRLI